MIHSTPLKRNPFATQLCEQIDNTTTCFKSEIRRKNKPNLRVHNLTGQPHSSTIKSNSSSCLSFIRYLVCFVCVIKIVAQLPSNSFILMLFFCSLVQTVKQCVAVCSDNQTHSNCWQPPHIWCHSLPQISDLWSKWNTLACTTANDELAYSLLARQPQLATLTCCSSTC